MLLQFSVSNFKSIKEESYFTAIANNEKEHENNLIKYNKTRVLPTLGFYGANASGKSNIFIAMEVAILFVRNSHLYQVSDEIPLFPFSFDDKYEKGKTKIDFIFVHNNKKYAYGFVANKNKVYEEYLYEYKSSKPSKIFERTDVNKYSFPRNHSKLNDYTNKNTDNKLFLNTATAWNAEATKDAFLWFNEIQVFGKHPFYSEKNRHTSLNYLSEYKNDLKFRSFIKSLLHEADIGIVDYDVQSEFYEVPFLDISEMGVSVKSRKEKRINTIHKIKNSKSGKYEQKYLELKDESDGTQLLILYGPLIWETLTKGRTILIDEIDNSLHISLAKYLIELFNNKEINRNGAQLIFITHDTNLLDLDIFRKDQIYFVEKDGDTGASQIYSLAEFDFDMTKPIDIRKCYLHGRFGAMPFIGEGVKW